MNYHNHNGRQPGQLAPPRRNNYFYGKLLDVPHLQMEQGYTIELRRMLNRLSLGTGVLCGLGVRAEDGQLCVLPGVAVDAQGREIIVPERYCLDPWQLTDRCGRVASELSREREHQVTICLAYHECLTDHMPVMVADCNTKDACAPGTILESFSVLVRPGAPEPLPAGLPPEVCTAIFGPNAGQGRGNYAVVATLDLGGAPSGIAISADGARALVLNRRPDETALLQVIEIATNQITELPLDERIRLPWGGVSVAPEGGPALVTHAGGVTIVDLTASPPAITDTIAPETAYGVCAAAFGGATLFAVNLTRLANDPASGALDRIDLAAQKIIAVAAAPGIVDLAISPDASRWLYVAVTPDSPLLRIDTGTNQIANPPSVTGRTARSVAARSASGGPEARVAYVGATRIFGESGPATDVPLQIDPRDSAFTGDGARYYVLSAAPNATAELAIFDSTDHSAIARVPVGGEPLGLAIVPGRLRALVTNSADGTVSVIDLGPLDRRRLLCDLLAGPCPTPPGDTCVPLAVVRLLPGGLLGAVEPCAYRPMLYSNATLLDLILCLAQRVDECCGAPEPPTPVTISIRPAQLPRGRVGVAYPTTLITASDGSAPYSITQLSGALPPGLALGPAAGRDDAVSLSGTPTQAGRFGFSARAVDANGASATRPYSVDVDEVEEPPRETLRITGLELITRNRDSMGQIDSPSETFRLRSDEVAGIRVFFSQAVAPDSVTPTDFGVDPDTVSFRVQADWINEPNLPGSSVPGEIEFEAPDIVIFWIREFGNFRQGEARVILLGNDSPATGAKAIRTPADSLLDGEPTRFPTGDSVEGGDFVFRFLII